MKNIFLKNKATPFIVLLIACTICLPAFSLGDQTKVSKWIGENKGLVYLMSTVVGIGGVTAAGFAGKKIYDYNQKKSLAEEISDQKNQENPSQSNDRKNDFIANEENTQESASESVTNESTPAMSEPDSKVNKFPLEGVAPQTKGNNTQEKKLQDKNSPQEESDNSNSSSEIKKNSPNPVIVNFIVNDKSEESTNDKNATEDSTDNEPKEEDDDNPFVPSDESFSDKWGPKFESAASTFKSKLSSAASRAGTKARAMGSSIKENVSSAYQSGKTKVKNTELYKEIDANRNPEKNLAGMLAQVKKGIDSPQVDEPVHKIQSFDGILGASKSLKKDNNDADAGSEEQKKQLDKFEKMLTNNKKIETENLSTRLMGLDLNGVKTEKNKSTTLGTPGLDLDEGSLSRRKKKSEAKQAANDLADAERHIANISEPDPEVEMIPKTEIVKQAWIRSCFQRDTNKYISPTLIYKKAAKQEP